MFEVDYYKLPSGEKPVEQFISRKIILTNGFVKKTKKTPQSEIALARKYKADYERRQKNERF